MDFSSLVDLQFEYMVKMRRLLHCTAELSGEEFQTAKIIENALCEIGIEHCRMGHGQGIVATLCGAKEGRTIALRADMDALPLAEKTACAFASKTKGVMHACGHDAHMAIALGCARAIASVRDTLAGNVKFIFQPAEETDGGAEDMINAGALENPRVERVIGGHVMPDYETGTIMLRHGAIMAAPDDFSIRIIGRGGHGAYPHKCVNPIIAASALVLEIEKIAVADFGEHFALSCCVINSNTSTWNLIPDSVLLGGTARSLSERVRTELESILRVKSEEIAQEFGVQAEFSFRRYFPPTISDDKAVDEFMLSAKRAIGENNVICGDSPSMAGEDFSYYALAVPSVFIHIGCADTARGIKHVLHSPLFELDERCLRVGAKCYCAHIFDFLSQ
ncbi:MAG: M20 family metallopeptidase [Clostridia bacterium]|nr:M20 family metallopeptidase [Clostridia bacterium]